MTATPTIAFLAEGKLFLKRPDAPPQLLDSPFVQGILDRVERQRERHEWKEGGLWQFGIGSRRGFPGIAGMQGMPPLGETRRIRFTGVTRGPSTGELLYTLDTDHVGGLFTMNVIENQERRLFHRQQFRASDVARHPQTEMLAVSLHAVDGTAHLAIMEQGRGFREISEGDCVDEAPSWVSGQEKLLVFHSAGIGRNQAGFVNGLGPYAIQQMDLKKEKVTTLVEDDAHDHLLPRITSDGSLFFIRRPYHAGPVISPWRVALDILLFPYRLIVAILHFLNFFSLMFSRKPLMTAGGPPREGPDARYLMLWGKVIDAEKVLRKQKRGNEKSLVPSSWQLIRRHGTDGLEQILARGVLAYDVTDDGTVVYSDGSRLFLLDETDKPIEIGRGRMIERLSIVSA